MSTRENIRLIARASLSPRGLTVHISRYSKDPTIAYIHQKLVETEHCNGTSKNIHTPYNILSFVYLVCFHRQSTQQSNHFHGIIFRLFLGFALLFVCVHTNWNLNRMFSSTFQIFLLILNKNYYNLTFYSYFSTPATFFEKMEPMFEIHYISIATDDGIIRIDDDVNIYPVYNYQFRKLSKLARQDHCFRPYFCQYLVG